MTKGLNHNSVSQGESIQTPVFVLASKPLFSSPSLSQGLHMIQGLYL